MGLREFARSEGPIMPVSLFAQNFVSQNRRWSVLNMSAHRRVGTHRGIILVQITSRLAP